MQINSFFNDIFHDIRSYLSIIQSGDPYTFMIAPHDIQIITPEDKSALKQVAQLVSKKLGHIVKLDEFMRMWEPSLQYAPAWLHWYREPFREHKLSVLLALECGSLLLSSNALQNDRDVALAAVSHNGTWAHLALHNSLSPKWKDDKEVVLAAVRSHGGALEFASRRLKRDKEVVLAAVEQDGMAIKFACRRLQGDEEISSSAIRNNPKAIDWIPKIPTLFYYDELFEDMRCSVM